MDSTRISIARILALGVPLTWQDAVAVAQEAAMLSDVNAAMNSRPSLVTPETCFITRAGDLELPETTDIESPDGVAELLRAMLGDSDVPEPLVTLAYGSSTRDLSSDLAAFPVGNRRAVIARLAARAIAGPAAPAPAAPRPDAPSVAAAPPRPQPSDAASTAAAWPPPAERPPAPIPFPAPTAQLPPPFVATPRPAMVVQPPPFVAAPAATPVMPPAPPAPPASAAAPGDAAAPSDARRMGPAPPAPDAELRRLRTRTVEREQRNQRLFARVVRWLAWRPDSPDPRVLGGAAVVVAAIVSMVWRTSPPLTGPGRVGAEAATAVTSNAVAAPPSGAATPRPADVAASPTAPSMPAGAPDEAAARARTPRTGAATAVAAPRPGSEVTLDDARTSTDTAPVPAASVPAPPAAAIMIPAPPATPAATAPVSEGRRTAASPVGPRARGRATLYSANDADVAPPVMLRQQLPSSLLEPGSDVPEDWPYLELLIDEKGAVERVRLRARTPAPGQTLYRHRMLIAAAKAWQFEPAQFNGQPVRYVMRVPLEP